MVGDPVTVFAGADGFDPVGVAKIPFHRLVESFFKGDAGLPAKFILEF